MAIDRKKIINDLAEIHLKSDADGLMPYFGVMLNRLPVSFWNLFSAKIINASGQDLFEAATGLLENAAAECGYNTGHGIINSTEFAAIVQPMIEDEKRDTIMGFFAVVTALGWGQAEVTELVPGERLVVRVQHYYEAELGNLVESKALVGCMFTGVCRALMDLVYGAKPYPDGLGEFQCKQTRGLEVGDPFGEFVVTR